MSQQGPVPPWVRYFLPPLLVAVVVAGVGLVLAFVIPGEKGRESTLLEVGKLCAQFIVLVLLGYLVTGSLDRLRARQGKLRAVMERREDHVKRLIGLTHEVDLARLLISANRSVKSWSDQMVERVIPAYTELRDLAHDQATATAAHEPIFAQGTDILNALHSMNGWLKALCAEFADHKKALSELQRRAETERAGQDEVWDRMQALPLLGDLVNDGPCHEWFRDTYKWVLTGMRSELSGTPSSADPRGGRPPAPPAPAACRQSAGTGHRRRYPQGGNPQEGTSDDS